jgi:DNA-binding transcriptional MerR regulator
MGLKKRYSATQAARLLGVKPHVLRFWEKRFEIRPERNSAGRRIYSQDQVEKLRRIKFLRYDEQFTTRGARSKLAALSRVEHSKALPREHRATLLWLKKELTSLRDALSEPLSD